MTISEILFFIFLLSSYLALKTDTNVTVLDTRIPGSRQIIFSAYSDDPFFKDLQLVKVLGKGTYGVVFEAKATNKKKNPAIVAIKFSKADSLMKVKSPYSKTDLEIPESDVNNLVSNMRVLDFAKSRRVPFLQDVISYRYLLGGMVQPNKGNEKKHGELVGVQLTVMDLADMGDLRQYSKKLSKSIQSQKAKIITEMVYQLLLGLKMLDEIGVVHGDIKPDNIFIKSCNISSKQVCPVIGDWDLAYLYKRKTGFENQLRYSRLYRAPELHIFSVKESELLVGPGGYSYSGKEDIFALGMSILEILINLEVSYENASGLFNLLEEMIYPLTLAAGESVFTNDNNYFEVVKQVADEYYSPNFSDANGGKRNEALVALIVDKLSLAIQHEFRMDGRNGDESCLDIFRYRLIECKQYPKAETHLLVKFIQSFMNICDISKIIQKTLTKEDVQFLEVYKTIIEAVYPFKEMVKNRISAADALDRAYLLHYSDETETDAETIKDDIKKALRWANLNKSAMKDPYKGMVTVEPSFYWVPEAERKEICSAQYNIRKEKDGRAIIDEDETQTLNVDEFCAALVHIRI